MKSSYRKFFEMNTTPSLWRVFYFVFFLIFILGGVACLAAVVYGIFVGHFYGWIALYGASLVSLSYGQWRRFRKPPRNAILDID